VPGRATDCQARGPSSSIPADGHANVTGTQQHLLRFSGSPESRKALPEETITTLRLSSVLVEIPVHLPSPLTAAMTSPRAASALSC
jgi:hypothetical protein